MGFAPPQNGLREGSLDCFAPLAMTGNPPAMTGGSLAMTRLARNDG
ncbi:MAG: hypothetical protein LBT00_00975 [Spirochaetaceae bacterium]|nr:hypothetical protein [Spirochaetaceae bacterium]